MSISEFDNSMDVADLYLRNETLTIRALLKFPEYQKFKVIAGEGGLDKEVKSITVMDAPDPYRWTKGGEIVLSSGYIFKQNECNLKEIIKKFSDLGIVGLFIKVKRFLGEFPEEIIDYCNEINFPVIDVPVELAFIEIIHPTLAKVIDTTSARLRRSQEVQKLFTELVLDNSDTQTIVSMLSTVLNKNLVYYNFLLEKFYFPRGKKVKKIIEHEGNLQDIIEKYPHYKIGVNDSIYGYVIFYDNDDFSLNVDSEIILRHANTALVLDYQKSLSSMQIETRHKNEFVQDILMKNIKYQEEVERRSGIYNWKFSNPMRVLLVDIDDFKKGYFNMNDENSSVLLERERQRINENTIRIVRSYFYNSVFALFSDSIAFIIQDTDKSGNFEKNLYKCMEEIKNSTRGRSRFTVSQGLGEIKNSIMAVHESFSQAQMCIKVGRVLYKSNFILRYSDLGVYRILFSSYNNEEVKKFYEDNLRAVLEYDRKYDAELFNTLMAISENNWNLKEASRAMFIHYNTIKYRFKKIEQIMGKDLTESEQRLDITLSLKLHKMNAIE